LPPAKGVTFAGYALPIVRGDFGGHHLRCRAPKARLDAHPLRSPHQPSTLWRGWRTDFGALLGLPAYGLLK